MRLVIEYTAGDRYTWHATITVPVEYESAEAFAVEFEQACRECPARHYDFKFAGHTWEVCDFIIDGAYYPPEIFTVDEWFAQRAQ